MLEGYTSLGFLAGLTTTVELQLLVTGVTYRHPGPARQDRVDARRALRRPGRARHRRRLVRAGAPRPRRRRIPPLAERFERLEETLQIVRQMWSEDDGPFEGRHYRLAETINSPQPLRTPPIMIGGGGEKKTLRLVAKYADALQPVRRSGPAPGPPRSRAKLDVLREHCDARGHRLRPHPRRRCSTPPRWTPGAEAAARFARDDGRLRRGRRHARCTSCRWTATRWASSEPRRARDPAARRPVTQGRRTEGSPNSGNIAQPKVVISAISPSSIRSTSILKPRNSVSPNRRR